MAAAIVTVTLTIAIAALPAQRPPVTRSPQGASAPIDSALMRRSVENSLAVSTSGVWDIDGEFKGARGEYFKLTGYFAYVASTSWSNDNGEEAVITMYLEPMAGGASYWIGARLSCSLASRLAADATGVRCVASSGASSLLDLNFTFRSIPMRGLEADAEISEPDNKDVSARFTSRSTPRGKFKIAPPKR